VIPLTPRAQPEAGGASVEAVLERERVMSDISRQVRAHVDVHAVLDTAVSQAGRALGALRAWIRVDDGESPVLEAEWVRPGGQSFRHVAHRLATANLASRDRRTIVIEDVRTAPEYDDPSLGGREPLLAAGTLSALAAPIIVSDRLIGVLGFHRSEAGPWLQAEVELAEGIAREAGFALQMARLLDETEQRLAQANALFEAARVVTGELRLDAVLERFVTALARLLRADAADCYLLDPQRGTLRCTAVYKLDPELVQWEFSADQGLAGEALRRGHSVFSRDHPSLALPAPHGAYDGFASSLIAPMVVVGENHGVVGVATRDPERVYTRADADLLESFAGLASVALRNAAAFEQSTRQARVQRGFYRIASALAEPLSLQETLDAVAQAALDSLGGVFAAALDSSGGSLALLGSRDLPDDLRSALEGAGPDVATGLHSAARHGKLVAAPALRGDDRFEEEWRATAAAAGARALLAIPLDESSDAGGRVVVVFFGEERSFSDDELELARHVAAAAAGALERSSLFETERRSRALAQHLARISSSLAPELDPAAVLAEVAHQVPELLGVDACVVFTPDGGDLVVAAHDGPGSGPAEGFRGSPRGLPAREAVESRAPVVREAAADAERAADPLLGGGLTAHLSVPVAAADGSIEAVIAAYAAAARTWRADEVDALVAVAASASAALANARLYQSVAYEKERSDAILAAIGDAIVATDGAGRIVLWNRAAERITGVPAAEAVGRAPADVLQRDLASPDEETGDRTIAINRAGHDVWLSLTEAVMSAPDGGVAGRVFAFRDVSSERVVEQMKSDFVSTVSHELRTPLTSIYGFSATLLRRDLQFSDEERRTFLAYIASESERLTRILDSLLHVARLDTGDLELDLAPTDVKRLVSSVVEEARQSAEESHRFVVDVPGRPLEARADESKLRQIVAALVDNAVKYSPAGRTVTVRARSASAGVELRVEDEGVGIAEAEQGRIFTKFYRSAEERGNGDRGPGLSLFIARGLLAAMGGRISVSSQEGDGATFVVELPAA
jgi:PAS domain S-box-containing protein